MAWLVLLVLQAAQDPARWIEDLDSAEIQVRERAEKQLFAAGETARPFLQRSAAKADEAGLRARRILRWLEYARVLPPYLLHQDPGLQSAILDSSPAVRSKALFKTIPSLVGGYRSPSAICRIALLDPDPGIRLQAAIKIGQDMTGTASQVALEFFNRPDREEYAAVYGDNFNSFVWDARSRIVWSRRATTEELLALLESSEPMIRGNTIEILSDLRRWEASPQVRAMLQDGAPNVVAQAIQYLERAGRLGEPDLYLEIIRSGARGAVYSAAHALRHLRAVEAVPEMLELVGKTRDDDDACGLLEAAAALDLAAVEPVALGVLKAPRDKLRPNVESTSLEVIARLGKSEHLDVLLGVLRLRSEDRFAFRLVGGNEEQFLDGLSRCIPAERYDVVLDLCKAHTRDALAYSAHGREDLQARLGHTLAYRLKNQAFAAAAMRRALDPALDAEKRSAACNALSGHAIAPEELARVMKALESPDAPPSLLGVIPWANPGALREPLREFCGRVLQGKGSPLKEAVLTRLWYDAELPLKTLAVRALEEDDRLAFPRLDYFTYLPDKLDVTRLVAKRLASPDPSVVLSVLQVSGRLPPFEDIAWLVSSPDETLRSAAMDRINWSSHRDELRRAVETETSSTLLARCIYRVASLRDRPGLKAALNRDLKPGSAEELARVKAIVAVGTPAELLALEPRLKGFPPQVLGDLLPALARADREAGLRFLPWAIVHPQSQVRVGAARSIAELRSTDHLPALSAMALLESEDVLQAARNALLSFERSVWLPVFRQALWGGCDVLVYASLASTRDPEAASDLREIVRQRNNYSGALAAQCLDALMNGEAHGKWGGKPAGNDGPMTLQKVIHALERIQVPARLSAAAQPWGDRPLARWISGGSMTLAQALGQTYVQGERGWVFFAPLSGPDGVKIVTLEEADEAWSKVFDRR